MHLVHRPDAFTIHQYKCILAIRSQLPQKSIDNTDTWDTSKLTVEDTHMRHPTQSSLIGVPGHLSHIIGQTRPSLISATAKATLHQAQSPSGKPKHITVQYGTCSPGRTLERSFSPWLSFFISFSLPLPTLSLSSSSSSSLLFLPLVSLYRSPSLEISYPTRETLLLSSTLFPETSLIYFTRLLTSLALF